MRYLAFTLAAPLASFGSIAVGERRPGWDRPAKSAVLGIIAGALGLTREETEAHRALADDYFYAVRVEDFGMRAPRRLLTDYHTAQTAPSTRGRRFATRREELLAEKLETILTRREYRTDCCFTALLWTQSAAPRYPVDAIAAALRTPAFTPYLGRKSCPLTLPMAPRLVEAEDPLEAFQTIDSGEPDERKEFRKSRGIAAKPIRVALDAAARPSATGVDMRIEKRRDSLIHRGRWQFGLREEVIIPLPGGTGG
ncbi:MAG TPA: type I-E CRISPR-associated protein Cas5/CasD [Candidatus Acidoferrum sp.]|jgi:CRISPR system Cascade subunit CasD|nr:type I-E CRISPR-associated protein Cas5/CasD [Candidatus Acidoferrum sp.]